MVGLRGRGGEERRVASSEVTGRRLEGGRDLRDNGNRPRDGGDKEGLKTARREDE